ncbi:hypothetical protein N656DRAFT_707363 [Canariomyces notabilis]|uniref:Uncharacterized protein n=1 Tax=Canariomyces notabilis TaxID=2074819 RepID=A0AAN6YTU7_9PEZI|nr:hypothetical protein N656DRAFT_707363 [Canariomyces arenarius]
MEAIVTRPTAPLSCCCRVLGSRTASNSSLLLRPATTIPSGARQKSSAARTRRALRIPPHPSFITSSPDGSPRPSTDRIVFNPPSSAASVYHTPFKFLPKSDPRRRANLAAGLFASSTTVQYTDAITSPPISSSSPPLSDSEKTQTQLPALSPQDLPVVVEERKPTHHLTKEDIEQMRALRAEDPVKNSVQALAERFGCSKLFVMMCCQSPREHRDRMKAAEEAAKARWGPRRAAAREERARRWEMVANGEI